MHELYNASGDAAVTIIPALVERGYQLVTVSELAQFRGGLAGGTRLLQLPQIRGCIHIRRSPIF